jgi:hypothetical protein
MKNSSHRVIRHLEIPTAQSLPINGGDSINLSPSPVAAVEEDQVIRNINPEYRDVDS